MNDVIYIKTFSKGQITIPKEVRDRWGGGDDFWLRATMQGDTFMIKPADKEEKKIDKEEYKKKLLSIKGDWLDMEDYRQIRQEVDDKLEKDWS